MESSVWTRVEEPSIWPTLAIALTMVAGAAAGNVFCDPQWTFLVLYIIPVMYAGWRAGLGAGLTTAIAGTVAYAFARHFNHHENALAITAQNLAWNTAMRLLTLTLVAFFAAKLRQAIATARTSRGLDSLTGVRNRPAFFGDGAGALAAAQRRAAPSAVATFDILGLKQVNTKLGTQRGDVVISLLARALWEASRKRDVVARIDGDTFAILMPDTTQEEATAVVLKTRARFADLTQSAGVQLSLSLGLCSTSERTSLLDEMVLAAERSAYVPETTQQPVRIVEPIVRRGTEGVATT